MPIGADAKALLFFTLVSCGAPPTPREPVGPLPEPETAAPRPDPCGAGEPWGEGKRPAHFQGLGRRARCRAELLAIMEETARALGVGCDHCHEADRSLPTHNKRVANWMAVELVPSLRKRDGGAIACADCHRVEGTARAKILGSPRRRDLAVEWMTVELVERFEENDGRPLYCRTCHAAGLGETGFVPGVILGHRLPGRATLPSTSE